MALKVKKDISIILVPLTIIALCVFVYILSLKSNNSSNNTSSPGSVNITNYSTESKTNEKISDQPQTAIQKTLSVDPNRCRGCGRCSMIDPEHFIISNRRAVIKTNDNLDSPNLIEAINSCPESAIKII